MVFPTRPAWAVRCPRKGRAFRQLLRASVLLAGGILLEPCFGSQPPDPIPAYAGPLLAAELAPGAAGPSTATWQPMQGSLPVTIVEAGDRRALRLPCNFKGTQIDRVSWDRPVQLDLSACRGVRFDFYCADSTPVSSFSIYLHSRSGWYVGSFHSARNKGWSSIVVAKSGMRSEEQPAGWGQIDRLRISAWRGENADTEFYLANLALDGADATLAIIRADSACTPGSDEAQAVATFTASMGAQLDALGLSCAVVSDADVTAGRLKGKTVAILPHNPGMPAAVVRELAAYMAAGGKLLAFYSLPPELASAGGIVRGAHMRETRPGEFASIRATGGGLSGQPPLVGQASWNIYRCAALAGRSRVVATWFDVEGKPTGEPALIASSNCVFMGHVLLDDDPANKRALLLAMLGSLDEGQWQKAVANACDRAGRFGPYTEMQEALHDIRREARGNARALQQAGEAQALYSQALQREQDRQFPEALHAAEQARVCAMAAYCAAQQPQRDESRAWWCHSAFGVAGQSWDEAVGELARNGFTAVIPNMLWGGVAFYNSTVLPVAPAVREQGDQLAACLAACRKHGVQCHVWKVNWNMGHQTPQEFIDRMVAAGRTQLGFDGSAEPRWLCPSHPDNQQLEIDAMVEVATKYDVDGIHFDYIRYPDAEHCFCPGCRERFEAVLGRPVPHWPADTRKEPAIRQAWLDFRRANITKVVAAVHEAVKQQKPKVQLSAAVFPNWTMDRDGVGQDWQLWCERGYLDFVCPMDYTPDPEKFASLVERQRTWAGQVPLRPGIGLSTWPGATDVPKLIEMVKLTRQLHTGGFTIFNYGSNEAARVLPLCGQGLTRPMPAAQ